MKNPTYENAIKKLEEITQKLENSELPLEESIKLFEEGTKLVGLCSSYLDKAEQKITQLSQLECAEDAE